MRWNPRDRDGYIFDKAMDETMGPCEVGCPAAILALLTPTQYQYAKAWRERCYANLALRRRGLMDGARIRLGEPVTLADGHVGDEFIVGRQGRRIALRDAVSRRGYRVTRLTEHAWIIIPKMLVHATVFA